jgi:competence protein ComEA
VVKHPGMYPLSAKTMAIDVIKMAEPAPGVTGSGLAKFAAMPVTSGDAIEVHFQADGTLSLTKGTISVAERLVMGIPLDINSMSEVDFDRVPGVGPAMAKRIVLYRQKNGGIMSAQDLIFIEGIGEKKFSALRRYFK